jgi:hypothetical protein
MIRLLSAPQDDVHKYRGDAALCLSRGLITSRFARAALRAASFDAARRTGRLAIPSVFSSENSGLVRGRGDSHRYWRSVKGASDAEILPHNAGIPS